MIIMASGIARGCVRTTTTTTTTESRNMAAILQTIGYQRQLWFAVYFFDIGRPCYDQLTPVKHRVSADQYHVAISRAQV